jgi:hypothetical protein
LAFAFALAACGPERDARCDLSAARDIAFVDAEGADTVIARTFGPSCDRAIGLYAVRDAEGRPIWAWASPLPRAFGEDFGADGVEPMQAFLERWTQPTLTTSNAAPEWSDLAPGQTTLDRSTYEDIRARDLPMLCHFSGTARETCVFWEPAAGGAGHFFDRDVEETGE